MKVTDASGNAVVGATVTASHASAKVARGKRFADTIARTIRQSTSSAPFACPGDGNVSTGTICGE